MSSDGGEEEKKKKKREDAKQCIWAVQVDIIERKKNQCLADIAPVIKKVLS